MPTYLYHITHISNLPSILNSGGLLAYNRLRRNEIPYVDIAHENIQDRRTRTRVPCGAKGVLHDYVPFYFAARSPMLNAIHNGRVKGYDQGQEQVLHLVSAAEDIDSAKVPFVFTDGHAIMAISRFFDDLGNLDQVDWEIMKAKYWADTDEDGDRRRRRMAEFLVYEHLPWRFIRGIGVNNENIQTQAQDILQSFAYDTSVKILPNWYY